MGSGYGYKCSKCGNEYSFLEGIGYAFPQIYKELMEKIRSGEYGDEWKELVTENERVVVDANLIVFKCDKCRYWKCTEDLSLYIPSGEEIDLDEAVSLSPDTDERLKLLKEYVHSCKKCGGKMHKATSEELDMLPCPECGTPNKRDFMKMVCWD